jgi:homogentisate 1,2-dioxygenase
MSKGDDGLKYYHHDDDEDVENAKLNEDDGEESGDGGESTKSKTKQPGLKGDLHMFNSDGDFLIVPQQRTLRIQTELGIMTVAPGEICVIPRGVVFTVNLVRNSIDANKEQAGEDESSNDNNNNNDNNNFARGYVLEIFRGHFQLPELGPIGSNGLANARDFLHPTAHYESDDDASAIDNNRSTTTTCTIVNKFGQNLFARTSPRTPYNVVAWHGNYLPFKYDLRRFCAVNSVTYDHPDPSIYTVLTAKGGDEDGTALADFVIFPPRILATDENTFRPPWFHRNVMTEFMGLINGEYDAKKKSAGKSGGFVPGGASLHSIMTPHGPDAGSYYANVKNPCDKPTKLDGGLAFMFESSAMCKVSRYALECEQREVDYASCWDGFRDTFPESHA